MKKPPIDTKQFPAKPGVYLFKDKSGKVIYVGKAKNLKNRVRAYAGGRDERPHIEFLRRRIASAEFIITRDEKEALLLENTLIKEHQPKYNVMLKDDKMFLGIRLGIEHEFPGVSFVRKSKKDGALYFGPYTSSLAAREIMHHLSVLFGIRTCRDRSFSNRQRPCLKKDLGRCLAPCAKDRDSSEYKQAVRAARLFLEGKSGEVENILRQKMKKASDELKYEEAAKYRDALDRLEEALKGQRVVDYRGGDADCWAVEGDGGKFAACLVVVRRGVVRKRRLFALGKLPLSFEDVMSQLILLYYRTSAEVPPELYCNHVPDDAKGLSALFKVKIDKPNKKWKGPVELASDNALTLLDGRGDELEQLQGWLGLRERPEVIEAVDVSHLGGERPYGSLVRYSDGKFEKSGYRLFKLKSGADDYSNMYELISRRFKRGDLPNLLLIDGGKGQLSMAVRVVEDVGLEGVELAAISKGEKRKSDGVIRPEWKDAKPGKKNNKAYLLLAKLRDEAHRFGINAQRRSRKNKIKE